MWVILISLLLLLGFFKINRKRHFSLFRELGIPGPEPSLLFGNFLELIHENPMKCHHEWLKKYGKVVGFFYGLTPVVLVADVNLLKRIQQSDFQNFMNRPNFHRSRPLKPEDRIEGFSQQLITLRDKRWKEVRAILTPTFTTSKMKQMAPIMNKAIDSLMSNVERKCQSGESFDIYTFYQGLTMDVVGRTAFGIQTDVQNDPNDPFLKSAQALFSNEIKSVLLLISASFPSLGIIWSWLGRLGLTFRNKGVNPIKELINTVKEVIASRRKNKENKRPDLLQLMLDAKINIDSLSSEDLTASVDKEISDSKVSVPPSGKLSKRMSDADVLDNSLLFFLAAYETTSTALAFTTHFLMHYPDVQEKVREEVLELIKTEGELNYNTVPKLQYLDQVIQESLRLYPPVYLFVTRDVSNDIDMGEIKLKKGMGVQVAVYQLHRDPEIWEEPDEFRPERFSPENKYKINPLAYQPFGSGPRNCIGMRFAMLEMKLALARLISKYKLKICAQTEPLNLELKIAQAQINPKKGIWTKVIPLEN